VLHSSHITGCRNRLYKSISRYVPELAAYASLAPLGVVPSPNPRAYVPNPLTWVNPPGLVACKDCGRKSEELLKGDHRRQAFNAARQRAGIPRHQQPVRQWTIGDGPSQKYRANYHYDPAPGSRGRYYENRTPNGPRVIAEHTNDPTGPAPAQPRVPAQGRRTRRDRREVPPGGWPASLLLRTA
jgi:hypothetical protein